MQTTEVPREPESPDAREPESADASVRGKHRTSLRGYRMVLLVLYVVVSIGGCLFLEPVKLKMQSHSMEPTVLAGDRLLMGRFLFGRPRHSVRRGEMIVFRFPYQEHSLYVHRVIGTSGDRIKIANQRVYVNGQPLTEPYAVHDAGAYDPFGDNFPPSNRFFLQGAVLSEWATQISHYIKDGELVVPPDRYFVMGDNRDHSWDSRYWGFVDRDAIMGRPLLVYWSATSNGPRWDRIFHAVH